MGARRQWLVEQFQPGHPSSLTDRRRRWAPAQPLTLVEGWPGWAWQRACGPLRWRTVGDLGAWEGIWKPLGIKRGVQLDPFFHAVSGLGVIGILLVLPVLGLVSPELGQIGLEYVSTGHC